MCACTMVTMDFGHIYGKNRGLLMFQRAVGLTDRYFAEIEWRCCRDVNIVWRTDVLHMETEFNRSFMLDENHKQDSHGTFGKWDHFDR